MWRQDGDHPRIVPAPSLGLLAALLFVAHLLVMGGGHHAPEAVADPHTIASSAGETSQRQGDALLQAGHTLHTDVGQASEAGVPHEEPSCGNTLRMRDGVDAGAALPAAGCVYALPQLTEYEPLIAVPAPPRTPDLVRELQVQRV